MVNIQDIADYSGYSKSTVSRVLNHKKYVSKIAQQQINAAIKELNYVPNAMAQGLSVGEMHNIGIVIPHDEHPYSMQIIQGVMYAAFAANYRIMLLPSNFDQAVELNYLEQLRRKVFDSLIFTSYAIDIKTLQAYRRYGPIVICRDPGSVPLAASFSERIPSYVAAFEWIKARGYQKIALLATRSAQVSATSQTTVQAYEQVFHRPPDPALIRTGIQSEADGYRAAEHYVTHNLDVDFIFANGDDVAVGVRKYYLTHHLPVPALMGQENQVSSYLLNIPTIDHHLMQVGKNTAKLAITGEISKIPVNSEFIDRT